MEGTSEEIEESRFSQITLNEFLRKNKEFYSVNIMLQMEYCSGESLEKFLRKRNQSADKLDRRQSLLIFAQIMKGIETVHSCNVVHRDLKPDNIFIHIDEKKNSIVAKIGDFGLARTLGKEDAEFMSRSSGRTLPTDQEASLRTAGMSKFSSIAGTEAYMAPEIKQHFLAGTRPEKNKDTEVTKK